MRRVTLLFWLLGAPLAAATEVGESRPFGLGVLVGDPTGVSAKLYISGRTHAIDAAIGGDTYGASRGSLYAHATYLWHPRVLLQEPAVTMPWHFGVGAFVGGWTDRYYWNDRYWDTRSRNYWYRRGQTFAGLRVPVGLDLDFNKVPIQVFADLSGYLTLVPWVGFDIGLGIGVRYYF